MSLALELNQKGITNREELAEQSVDELIELINITEEVAAELIMKARAHWFE
jgi:N utilization substance protein A